MFAIIFCHSSHKKMQVKSNALQDSSQESFRYCTQHTYCKNSTSGMTVCYICCINVCMCYPCPSCRHTTAASRSSQSLLQMVPHTPFRYTSTVPSNLDLPPCSRKEPANAHKKNELNLKVLLTFTAQPGDKNECSANNWFRWSP